MPYASMMPRPRKYVYLVLIFNVVFLISAGARELNDLCMCNFLAKHAFPTGALMFD